MDKVAKVFIAGDSTAAAKEAGKRPETGWAERFSPFLGHAYGVENRAVNGRSSRSFITEGRLDAIASALASGDCLFIQFGHNDEKDDPERHTEPEREFPEFLLRYVSVAHAAGAMPVLLTPIVRRRFDDSDAGGRALLLNTHGPWLAAVKRLASERNVPLLDLEARTRSLVESLGPEASKALYLHAGPGVWPAYPEGIADDTHLSEAGAVRVASLVADEVLRAAHPFPALAPLARAIGAAVGGL